jgi:hypothetical protein
VLAFPDGKGPDSAAQPSFVRIPEKVIATVLISCFHQAATSAFSKVLRKYERKNE